MNPQILIGGDALSAFRIARLRERLSRHGVRIGELRVVELFLVQARDTSAADLRRLLGEGSAEFPRADHALYVVPRIGTTSPWCSKATDIARVCGLEGVSRIERGHAYLFGGVTKLPAAAYVELHDPMTESVLTSAEQLAHVFDLPPARGLRTVDVLRDGKPALEAANRDWGLALSGQEMDYLVDHYQSAGRNPTDAELMMFAQVNSEHCRHKIFNAQFSVDGAVQPHSLFEMIKLTYRAAPEGVLSAYKDNAAVIAGPRAMRLFQEADGIYREHREPVHLLMKVETHNHPTGISPHPGAGTGAGGEIRDEAATGRGAKPKAGLCGFTVSNLRIPGFEQPWEEPLPRPPAMASALQVMLEGPIGAAAYNNEFGRPNLNGYFRTFETRTPDGRLRGYHKPIMIAGGYGNIRDAHVEKHEVIAGAKLVVLGGPAMLIGLGGGAASSMATGSSSAELDFASVQRANPELQRRCQQVIDACWALGGDNPILSIHDVGAGGLSNALPELVHADSRGGHFQLRDIQSADPSLSPMEIWCNEAQERYVLAIAPERLRVLEQACARERCPFAVVGTATAAQQLVVEDRQAAGRPVDLPMPVLLGKLPRMRRETTRRAAVVEPLSFRERRRGEGQRERELIAEAAERILRLPAVASKNFLITIGDRTVGGLTVRDQMVGPWQVPVADCAVTATGFEALAGEAMAMGERPILALLDAGASARMAVGEAIANIAAARIDKLADVRLSANWMAACGQGDEDARLFDAVKAVGAELCPQLGIAIPVGKDSLSMKSQWNDGGRAQIQTAPMSLIVSAFAPVSDVRQSLTPQLRTDCGETRLILLDLGNGQNRLGGSALAQVYGQIGDASPDLDDAEQLKAAFDLVQHWNADGKILAYHDRSDGGLFAAICEMAFAGHTGVSIQVSSPPVGEGEGEGERALASLFSEELGLVLQVRAADVEEIVAAAKATGLTAHDIGSPRADDLVRFSFAGAELFSDSRERLHKLWSETSFRLAELRDNPDCAREEFESVGAKDNPGLTVRLSFEFPPPLRGGGEEGGESLKGGAVVRARPRVAILREQGVNSHVEMAYAFHAAGFESVDVHMTDLLSGRIKLADFAGVVACGGFSYGDVLGAGQGWAKTILFHARAREEFQNFLARKDRFALGVCNGCQMFAALKEIVPGAQHWPMFRRNRSEQFEARWGLVEILESKSLFFAGMAGSRLPIAIAHGEGYADFSGAADLVALKNSGQVAMRFVDNHGRPARRYPENPNGSPEGVTALCNDDGRVTILMPHPERSVAGVTGSWWPRRWERHTPWMRMFRNARKWVG